MEKIFTMSTKEIERIDILIQLQEKKLTQLKAADILGLSVRQVRRFFVHDKKQAHIETSKVEMPK